MEVETTGIHLESNARTRSRDLLRGKQPQNSSTITTRFSARLDSPQWPAQSPFTEADLRPMDRTSDRLFYLLPRFVQHVDERAQLAPSLSEHLLLSREAQAMG